MIVSDMAKHDVDLSPLFHALADPTRRAMLTRLAEAPARVTELAEPTGLKLPTVMRQLSVLEEAGLITRLGERSPRSALTASPMRFTWLCCQSGWVMQRRLSRIMRAGTRRWWFLW